MSGLLWKLCLLIRPHYLAIFSGWMSHPRGKSLVMSSSWIIIRPGSALKRRAERVLELYRVANVQAFVF